MGKLITKPIILYNQYSLNKMKLVMKTLCPPRALPCLLKNDFTSMDLPKQKVLVGVRGLWAS